MPKRSATELQAPPPKSHASGRGEKPHTQRQSDANGTNEMGEFEDAWEDEIESDEGGIGDQAEGGEAGEDGERFLICLTFFDVCDHDCGRPGMEIDDEVLPAIEEEDDQPPAPDIYIPGKYKLSKDEILEPDQSVYVALHSMSVNWPCLSFDILRDNFGDERSRFPTTSYAVAGTQADVAKNNEVLVLKMSQLHRTQKDGGMFLRSL
jgi:ribosome assembly protein RRB1